MELLGPSILDLFLDCGHSFTLKTVLMIADVFLHALENLHIRGVVHRDIKPDNLAIGCTPQSDEFYLIDFGLSKEYMQNGAHVLCRRKVPFQGNMYWASNNVLKGLTASRRDDVESLLYVLIYLYRGDLPWYIAREKHCTIEKVLKRKKAMTPEEMCNGLPPTFAMVLAKVQALTFPEVPDYEGYRTAFRELFASFGYSRDRGYDWKNLSRKDIAEVCLDDVEIVRSNGGTFATEVEKEQSEYDGGHRRASSSSPSKHQGHNPCPAADFQTPISPKLSLRKRLAALNTQFTSPGRLMQKCGSSSSSSSSPASTVVPSTVHPVSLQSDTGFRLRLIQVENETAPIQRSKTVVEDLENAETPKSASPVITLNVRKKRHLTVNL